MVVGGVQERLYQGSCCGDTREGEVGQRERLGRQRELCVGRPGCKTGRSSEDQMLSVQPGLTPLPVVCLRRHFTNHCFHSSENGLGEVEIGGRETSLGAF